MTRQPLKTRLPNTGLSFGAGFLAQRPIAAALVAQCLAMWTEVELQVARVLAAMLKADSEPVIAMYFTLANERAKREVMEAVAAYINTDAEKYLFDTIMKIKQSFASQRNDLAHGLFGIASEDKEGLLWISTKDRIKNLIAIDKVYSDEKADLHAKGNAIYDESRKIADFVQHYKIKDIESLLEDLTSLHRIMHKYVGCAGKKSNSEVFQSISREPLVQRFQSPIDENQKDGA